MDYRFSAKAEIIPAASSMSWRLGAAIVLVSLALLAAAKDRKPAAGDNSRPQTIEKEKTTQQPAAQKQKKEEVTIAASAADFAQTDIYFGSIISNQIVNPRCLDTATLLWSIPEAAEAKKNEKSGNQAKYWILLSRANDRMNRRITEYVAAEKISFLCKRQALFALLRQREEYKKKSEKELITAFDVSEEIIERFAEKNNKDRDEKGWPWD